MGDVARDPAALELLRVQRSRLADRMRPPWWYLPGMAILWALTFTAPFSSRYFPQGFKIFPILLAVVAVAWLLQWGLTRATGIAVAIGSLRYPSGRPAEIAVVVGCLATIATEYFLIDRGPIVVAALAVVAEVAAQQAHMRGIRQDLRAGGGVA